MDSKKESAPSSESKEATVPHQMTEHAKSGTKLRGTVRKNSSHATSTKVFLMGTTFMLLLGFVFGLIPYIKVKMRAAGENAAAATTQENGVAASTTTQQRAAPEPVVTQGQAEWTEGTKDGFLPVGVWSKPVAVEPGCSPRYPGGYGVLYVAQYRFYDTEWKDQKVGTSPNMSDFRFMVLQEGVSELLHTTKCS